MRLYTTIWGVHPRCVEYAKHLYDLEYLGGNEAFLGGKQPDLADISFFAPAQSMSSLYKSDVPEEFPKLRSIYENFAKRPSAGAEEFPPTLAAFAPVRRDYKPTETYNPER